jgi:hypothetical protein
MADELRLVPPTAEDLLIQNVATMLVEAGVEDEDGGAWNLAVDIVRCVRTPVLPEEPPVGSTVITSGSIPDFFRRHSAGWSSARHTPMAWPELLRKHGPVTVLGEWLEYPR